MHPVEITNFLDERISELAKNRLPEEPGYRWGNSEYASFMMPRDDMSINEKSPDKWSNYTRSTNGNWDDQKTKQDRLANARNGSVPKRLLLTWS